MLCGYKILCLILILSTIAIAQPWNEHGRLQVSAINSHYLAHQDGTAFFWLGDTAWKLFHQTSREEAELYLENRRMNDFNVIQAVAIVDVFGLTQPNYYGDLPLLGRDPTHPDTTTGNAPTDSTAYDYWDHVGFIIDLAASKNLYIGLVAIWGEYVTPRYTPDNLIFKTTAQAYRYGYFLGNRYQNRPNIIWILGGDRHPDEHPNGIAIWRAMAEGIADGTNGIQKQDGQADYTSTVMTHHSFGTSAQWFHHDPWIDLHTFGSYHFDFYLPRAYEQAEKDWSLPNPKPTLNSEPAYENHPVNWLDGNGVFVAYDVRQTAYWSVFAGSVGHTYGAHPIWQFYDTGKTPESPTYSTWKEALHFPGGMQMKFLKRLIESRPMLERIPDQSLILAGQGTGGDYVLATRGKNYALIYLPTGRPVTIKLGIITGKTIKAWWYNPRTGEATLIEQFENVGQKEFDPPGISPEFDWLQTGRGCDWVLVLDDASAGFSEPSK